MCENFFINALKRQALTRRMDLSVHEEPAVFTPFWSQLHFCPSTQQSRQSFLPHAHFRRCSAPASHNFGITRYPPSNKINGLQFQYRVTKLVLDKLFALGRDVCETRQLRQTRPVRSLRTLEFLRLFIGKIYPYCRDQSNLTSCLVSLFKVKL